MSVFNFAHGGVSHASETEAITHESGNNIVWIVLASVVMAAILYTAVRLLSKRQTQEQTSREESDS